MTTTFADVTGTNVGPLVNAVGLEPIVICVAVIVLICRVLAVRLLTFREFIKVFGATIFRLQFVCIIPELSVTVLAVRAVVKREAVTMEPFAFCIVVVGIESVVNAGPPMIVCATVSELTETEGVVITFA